MINRASGFLALDRNQNGKIDNGSELFGEHTAFKSYGNGYDALADEDSDHNGFIDSTDRVFSKLVVWIDDNQDGLSQSHEVKSLRELGISKISVGFETLAHSKGVLENQVRFKSKFFGPAYCSVNGCNSYDVFFATFRTSTEVAKNK